MSLEDVPTHEIAQELARRLADSPPHVRSAATLVAEFSSPCRHSIDFASVRWHAQKYIFTATQSAIIKILWEAWEKGTPEIRQETLLEAVGACGKITAIFQGHECWGEMIQTVPGKQGVYRLFP